MHLIRRRRQEPGLVLYLRARVLRAAFRQGPDGPELVRVGGPEDGGQAPGKVGQEFGGAPAMVHVLQNRVAGRSHGVVQDLGNGLQPCQCSGTVWPLRSGAVVVRPGRLSDASRGRCGATALPGPLPPPRHDIAVVGPEKHSSGCSISPALPSSTPGGDRQRASEQTRLDLRTSRQRTSYPDAYPAVEPLRAWQHGSRLPWLCCPLGSSEEVA